MQAHISRVFGSDYRTIPGVGGHGKVPYASTHVRAWPRGLVPYASTHVRAWPRGLRVGRHGVAPGLSDPMEGL